jgi:hypothetical protein
VAAVARHPARSRSERQGFRVAAPGFRAESG